MEIKHEQQGPMTIVSVTGSLDALTAPQFSNGLTQVLQIERPRLVLDLSGLAYTSSAGLRVMLNAAKDTRSRGGDLCLAAVRPSVIKVLEMSGFTSIFKFFPDVETAVKNFST